MSVDDPATLTPTHGEVLAADFDHKPKSVSVFGEEFDYCATCGFAVTPDGTLHAETKDH